jgi:putative ABC transport system permease protein
VSLWRQFTRGMRVLANRPAANQEISDEVTHYLEESTAAFLAKGLSPDEARRAARIEIGNVTAGCAFSKTSWWAISATPFGY